MSLSWSQVVTLGKSTFKELTDDDVPTLAAAIAYYTVFSLPPLLVIIVAVAGAVFGPETVTQAITDQIGSVVGPEGRRAVGTMIENASGVGSGIGGKLAGIAALLFGATGAFAQLQKALNRAWEVEEATEGGGIKEVILKRVLSFGMVLTIAFFLLVSMVISGALAYVDTAASSVAGDGLAGAGVQVLNFVISLAVIGGLFAVLFKYLPDAEIAWRDALVGGAVTAVLFTIGKTAIGIYLGTSDPGSAFGAAGSLALLLVWIYYSALILLVGAEFTQAWAVQMGGGVRPDDPDAPEGNRKSDTTPTVGGADSEVHPVAKPRDPAPY